MSILRGLTQADGAQVLDRLDAAGRAPATHQIQITCYNSSGTVAAPAAGTLTVKARTPGLEEYESVTDGTLDLTSRDNWLQTLDAVADSIQITPASLDAAATYDIVMV